MRTRVQQLLQALGLRQLPHQRAAGEPAAYYFDAAEVGVTTTSSTDESW